MGESILIVDDNLTNCRLFSLLLQREGYDVHTAGDAEGAVELLQTFHPRLILMDIQLPGMSGLDLTRKLKANTGTRDIIIIAFSGCTAEEVRQDALNAGCEDYLSKPVAPPMLIQRLAQHLHSSTPSPRRQGLSHN